MALLLAPLPTPQVTSGPHGLMFLALEIQQNNKPFWCQYNSLEVGELVNLTIPAVPKMSHAVVQCSSMTIWKGF